MRLAVYKWLFGCRWMPKPIRVWACRRGGMILVKKLEPQDGPSYQ